MSNLQENENAPNCIPRFSFTSQNTQRASRALSGIQIIIIMQQRFLEGYARDANKTAASIKISPSSSVLTVSNELFGPLPMILKALITMSYSVNTSSSVSQSLGSTVPLSLKDEWLTFLQKTK